MKAYWTIGIVMAAGLQGGPAPVGCGNRLGLPAGVSCYNGQDANGAYYLIAIPQQWNGNLVLYIHSGPRPTPPVPLNSAATLSVSIPHLADGTAVATSSFRSYGFRVSADAEDIENLRRIFIDAFGAPKRTVAEGLSYGGNVAAKLMELFGSAPDGSRNYDGAIIMCGPVAGIHRMAETWLDFRTVYQYYCANQPLPEEPQYDLWYGIPPDSGPPDQINDQALQTAYDRGNACTGYLLPADQRSQQQQSNLANMLNVLRTSESEFPFWLGFGTTSLYDIATNLLGGRNAFSNLGVTYQGSSDDVALNCGVNRYAYDPDARDADIADSEPTGKINAPIITLHGIQDDRVIVENEAEYRETLTTAGTADYLMQVYVNTQGHCNYSTSEMQAVASVFFAWLDTGNKPAPDDLVSACEKYRAVNGDECRFDPAYQPNSWDSRVYPRIP